MTSVKAAEASGAEIRRAVADYMGSEGCHCCEGAHHDENKATLGKLLKMKKYKDGSGYDYGAYQTGAALRAKKDRTP